MSSIQKYNFWFITGSQHLYGKEALLKVAQDADEITNGLNASGRLPCKVVSKGVVTTTDEITAVMEQASYDKSCAGVITWMHTFSPSKMWITGLSRLTKPYLHFHTQYNRDIPFESIDMDFMNLNQSAHGDREHGFIGARMRLARKIIAGYWGDPKVQERVGGFMRSAVGVMESRSLKVVRFGDNMRQVAVTEGDKVEAEIKLGWSINTMGVGDLVAEINKVTDAQIDAVYEQYKEKYVINTDNIDSIRVQIKYEIALKAIFDEGGFGAFTNTFEDLYGMEQLPGIATQRMLEQGYGYGGEGDWKTSAMVRIMKQMAQGLEGGTGFMEDYTYHLDPANPLILGAHMLEVCPTFAAEKPRVEVHNLGIGGKNPPARLVFDGMEGDAIAVTLIDMGGRMRLIVNDIKAVKPIAPMPKLPVARVMWKPLPDLQTAAEAWILVGGAHHTCVSFALTAEHMRDWAQMMDIEFVHIGEKTDLNELSKELMWNDIAFKLK